MIKEMNAGPHRIAGYEDIIDDAARELERVDEKLSSATLQYQRMQARVAQLEARAASHEETTWQVQGYALLNQKAQFSSHQGKAVLGDVYLQVPIEAANIHQMRLPWALPSL